MKRKWMIAGAGFMLAALGTGTGATRLMAAPRPQDAAAKPAYTLAEYNAYQAANNEQNPQMKAQKLDAFVMMYPMSTLMPFIYQAMYLNDFALKNYGGTADNADKLLAMGDKLDAGSRLQACIARAQAYFVGSATDKALQTADAQTKARTSSTDCMKPVNDWQKPAAMTADQFTAQQNQFKGLLNSVGAMASTSLKDYPTAATDWKAVIALNPMDAVSHFRLGVVDLQMMPPNANEGFWEMARSIGMKSPNGPNEGQVKTYMKNQLMRYQQPSCEKLADDQLNDVLSMAAGSATPPATFNIPSAADLDKARNDVANFIPALKMGGDAGKVMWLASCGLEYPDVAVRVMDMPVADGDNLSFKGYRPEAQDPDAAQKELEAATDANMEIHVMAQPEAKRIMKDDAVRFTGTLTGYTQTPFLLTWDKAKINAEDIPDEKAAGPAKKGAAKKAPAKKAQ
jgi:hypothetical protein